MVEAGRWQGSSPGMLAISVLFLVLGGSYTDIDLFIKL